MKSVLFGFIEISDIHTLIQMHLESVNTEIVLFYHFI